MRKIEKFLIWLDKTINKTKVEIDIWIAILDYKYLVTLKSFYELAIEFVEKTQFQFFYITDNRSNLVSVFKYSGFKFVLW